MRIEEDDGSEWIQSCLNVLAMGDKKAVALAQSAHEGLVAAAGIKPEQLVYHGAPPPSGAWETPEERARQVWVIICIDDAVTQGEVSEEELLHAEGGPERQQADALLEVYRREGLEPKASKVKRDAVDATVLGTQLRGRRGWASAPAKNIAQLMMLTLYVVCTPVISGSVASKLSGSWVWPMSHRRDVMCLLDEYYRETAGFPMKKGRRLSYTSTDELITVLVSAPLFRTGIRWPVETVVHASDAEGSGGAGVCEASLHPAAAEDLLRFVDINGELHDFGAGLARSGGKGTTEYCPRGERRYLAASPVPGSSSLTVCSKKPRAPRLQEQQRLLERKRVHLCRTGSGWPWR